LGVFRGHFAIALLFASVAVVSANLANAAPVYNWSGFYIGANANSSSFTSEWNTTGTRFTRAFAPTPPANVSIFGGLGTFTAGYDLQVYQTSQLSVLAGLTVDYSPGTISGRTDCFNLRYDCYTGIQNNLDLLGRVGINAQGAPFTIYATGGAAFGTIVDQKFPSINITPIRANPALLDGVTRQQWGWAVGAGGLYQVAAPGTLSPALPGALSFSVELLYQNFGKFDLSRGITDGVSGTTWKAGIIYNFGNPGSFGKFQF
jgi:hypothetical protein